MIAMETKPLVLFYEPEFLFFPYLDDYDVEAFYKTKTNRLLRKYIGVYIGRPFLFRCVTFWPRLFRYFFLGEWAKHIKKIDKIVIFDSCYTVDIIKYIKRENPNCEVFLYCWNILHDDSAVLNRVSRKLATKIYSFDRHDAAKYNLVFASSPYTKNIKVLSEDNPLQDIFFLGQDKGRNRILDDIRSLCQKNNIKTNFMIIRSMDDYVSYDEYLQMVFRSKALLDIVQPGQVGLTMRVLESIFFKKKLITNNSDLKNYDFYNENNIFILEERKMEELPSFLAGAYLKVDDSIISRYDFDNWYERIVKCEPFKMKE